MAPLYHPVGDDCIPWWLLSGEGFRELVQEPARTKTDDSSELRVGSGDEVSGVHTDDGGPVAPKV